MKESLWCPGTNPHESVYEAIAASLGKSRREVNWSIADEPRPGEPGVRLFGYVPAPEPNPPLAA